MVDDNPEDKTPSPDSGSPDSGRARRAPPTIELEASEVSGETRNAGEDARPEPVSHVPPSHEPISDEPSAPLSPWVIAALSGAVAASLVICVGWLLGWPAVLPATSSAPAFNAAVIDDLAARVASIEAKTSKPAAEVPDPAMVGRVEALEKSLASLRGDLSGLRAQSEKLAASVNDAKSTPRESAASVDLSAINERIAELERAARAQVSEIAQESGKPADDVPLRRVVAASVLDVSVRQGEPYAAALAPADRAAAQGWLDKADARDTALAASRQFASEAMAALAKPRQ